MALLNEKREEWSTVEFVENRLILGQIYSTLLYSLSLLLNPNGLYMLSSWLLFRPHTSYT